MRRIHRHRAGTADRLPVRARDPRADLPRLLPHRPRSRAPESLRQHSARALLLSVRPVRDLSGAPLPADAHGVARRALLDDGLGRGLCVARALWGLLALVTSRARAAVAARRARALQDAPYGLRRPSGPLRGLGLGVLQARLVALAACLAVDVSRHPAAVHLCGVQGHRVALVAERPAHGQGEPLIRSAEGRTDRSLLEDGLPGASCSPPRSALSRALR